MPSEINTDDRHVGCYVSLRAREDHAACGSRPHRSPDLDGLRVGRATSNRRCRRRRGSAAPAPDLVGTGAAPPSESPDPSTSSARRSSSRSTRTARWSWSKRGAQQASGRVRMRVIAWSSRRARRRTSRTRSSFSDWRAPVGISACSFRARRARWTCRRRGRDSGDRREFLLGTATAAAGTALGGLMPPARTWRPPSRARRSCASRPPR